MTLINGLLALALLATVVTAADADAPVFPFRTHDDVRARQVTPPVPACRSNQGVAVSLGPEWVVFSWPDRDLFIHRTNEEPDYVYLTVSRNNEPIVVKSVLTLEEAKARFPMGPCGYGDERLT